MGIASSSNIPQHSTQLGGMSTQISSLDGAVRLLFIFNYKIVISFICNFLLN
uniref:Uncharacterized protein n=1 Tax=Cajanus cajan TaxID=3821 RepID=A0A151RCE8_CAJCA|nr:hypothetical protein KK1_038462 [Cajanus cajan]